MARALTPTPQRAILIATSSQRAGATPVADLEGMQAGASRAMEAGASRASAEPHAQTTTTLAHESRVIADRLRSDATQIAMLTLRVMRPAPPDDSAASLRRARTAEGRVTLRTRTHRPSTHPTTTDWRAPMTTLAARLRPHIRRDDTLVIAPDGVAILLRDPAPAGARIVAQRLRDALLHEEAPSARAASQTDGYAVRMTLLLGVSHITFSADGLALSDSGATRLRSLTADDADETDISARPRTSAACTHNESSALFGARFATLFARTWEACATNPIILTHIDPSDDGAPSSPTQAAQTEAALRRQATALGVPFAQLPLLLPTNCRRAITRQLANELRSVPIGYAHAKLTVAMEHPGDMQAVDRLRQATGHTIFPVLAAADDITRAIKQLKA